ncbi:hypothetical protein HHK36_003921 [Tetracentron sinense]|uniref:Carbonic anhydrase n=1 Tax=Tetracentron sinense TaxID=13715 RepID=A0A834ZRZ3_TETSI|nr:hypothetical protein HHK36_003921 [Tetracentron sinense]
MAALLPSVVSQESLSCTNSFVGLLPRTSIGSTRISVFQKKMARIDETHLRLVGSVKRTAALRSEASRDSMGTTQELISNKLESVAELNHGLDLFGEMRLRENSDHYEELAKAQAPKFMVIACADSRVCPSNILGFQPGEAFVVRNVANLVPPFENGPSETNAALEFAVNSLEVENILVIGHSCCGGIRALMSMQDEVDSSTFIGNWVINGKNAKLMTKAAAANLSFDQQCKHCEKESVNRSLLNLLTYPWIEERVRKEVLSIHGGYYDFVNCTFEKWTLDYRGGGVEDGGRCSVKDRSFWC